MVKYSSPCQNISSPRIDSSDALDDVRWAGGSHFLCCVRETKLYHLISDWSTLIGRGMSRLVSHWSRASPVMLAPAILCHKEPARASKDSWLPCMRNDLLYHGAGGLWMPELVLYGIRLLAPASLGKLSTNESRASTFLDQWEWTRLQGWPT